MLSFLPRLNGNAERFCLPLDLFTLVSKYAAILPRLAPVFAIEISLRSSFHVNRPGLLPTMVS
jgi:hypothetical protein